MSTIFKNTAKMTTDSVHSWSVRHSPSVWVVWGEVGQGRGGTWPTSLHTSANSELHRPSYKPPLVQTVNNSHSAGTTKLHVTNEQKEHDWFTCTDTKHNGNDSNSSVTVRTDISLNCTQGGLE